MPDGQRNQGRDRGEQQAHSMECGFARAEMGVKPPSDDGADNGGGNPHSRIISPKADDLGCDGSGNCSQYDPADETDQHGASPFRSDASKKQKKPTRPNPGISGSNCVGLLVNG